MISAKFLWGNVLLGGKLQIGAKNSNFEIFESTLYMKSVSMPLNSFYISVRNISITNQSKLIYLKFIMDFPFIIRRRSKPDSNSGESDSDSKASDSVSAESGSTSSGSRR